MVRFSGALIRFWLLVLAAVTLALPLAAASASAHSHRVAHPKHHRAPAPRPASGAANEFAAAPATGALAIDLLRRLGGAGNVVLSPDSIEAALAMTGTGAGGATATQMATALHLTSPAAFPSVGTLQGTLASEQATAGAGDPQAPTLDLANGLFVQQGFPIESSFFARLVTSFGAAPQTVDFVNDNAGALQAIDGWVDARTDGIIPRILGSVDPATKLALANAIYLEAAWASPFEPAATASAPFQVAAGSSPTVPFMHSNGVLPYAAGPGYAAVDLPYRSSPLSLLVVLPQGQSAAQLAAGLTEPKLAQIAASEKPANVDLALPRFHVALATDLVPTLQALGMTDAFGPGADFSGITKASQLQIGVVQHAADFTLDEAGTIAAAATVATIVAVSEQIVKGPTINFNANHPFLFFLRDTHTGAVLFAGRMADPSAAPAPTG